jgi:hypothetical protein
VKWLFTLPKELAFAALLAIFLAFLIPVGFFTAAWIGFTAAWVGDKTGLYRVEDYICMNQDQQSCEEMFAEKKRSREKNWETQNRPPAISNPATKP